MLKKFALVLLFLVVICTIILITSLYQNNRIPFAQVQWRTVNNTNITFTKSPQYLWCVNHYGPNNQLKDFFKCCILGTVNNYTVIVPPLYPHYGRRNTHGIQWFDQLYDLKQLSLSVNLITLEQFISQAKTKTNKVMIECYIRQIELVIGRMWYPTNTLVSIQNHYKIKIDFHRYINVSRHLNMNELSSKSKSCSSIFLHIHYTALTHFFLTPNSHIQPIFEHLRRTVLIQRMASKLISLLPQLVIGKNHSQNNFSTLAVVHMRLGDYTVMSVSMYIKQILYLINSNTHFTHLHLMSPYINLTDMKQFTDRLPIAFTTTQQLLNHVRFVLDDYLFDVLEQEIAYQAPIFIASPWTTYSATVLMQKVYQNKGIVYVLSRNNDGRPLLVTKKNVKYFK